MARILANDGCQTYIDGSWIAGNPPVFGALSHAVWQASVVFDGARAFDGVTPDLDRHAARLVASARSLGLAPVVSSGEIMDLVLDGLARFPVGAELYIRPMFWADDGFVDPDPDTTRFLLTLLPAPLPRPTGLAVCFSTRRRPVPGTAPTEAKAACLYPNAGLALREAKARGFDNAIVLDTLGNVAELATANLFIATDGLVRTPVPNGTFLDGITRQRVIALMRADGWTVDEAPLTPEDILAAEEAFATGNHGKVLPITRIEDRTLDIGAASRAARSLYWDWATSRTVPRPLDTMA